MNRHSLITKLRLSHFNGLKWGRNWRFTDVSLIYVLYRYSKLSLIYLLYKYSKLSLIYVLYKYSKLSLIYVLYKYTPRPKLIFFKYTRVNLQRIEIKLVWYFSIPPPTPLFLFNHLPPALFFMLYTLSLKQFFFFRFFQNNLPFRQPNWFFFNDYLSTLKFFFFSIYYFL